MFYISILRETHHHSQLPPVNEKSNSYYTASCILHNEWNPTHHTEKDKIIELTKNLRGLNMKWKNTVACWKSDIYIAPSDMFKK